MLSSNALRVAGALARSVVCALMRCGSEEALAETRPASTRLMALGRLEALLRGTRNSA